MNVPSERLNLRAGALAILAQALWGGNSVAIKIALAGVPPIALAGIRFFLGGLFVLLWAVLNRIPIPMRAGERGGLFLLVLLFFAQIFLLNQGTHLTLASRSTIMVTVYPFFTSLFAHLFIPGDRLSRLKGIGMALSFSGVVLIFAETLSLRDFSYIPGDLMVFGSGILLGARQVYTKRLIQGIHPYRLLVWQSGLSLPMFALFSGLFEGQTAYRFSPDIVGAILYQGLVVAGFCFIVFYSLLRRYSASHLGVFGFVTPVFGVLLSDLLLHERLSPAILASMLLVGVGIAIANWEGREQAAT